jgi:tripartite-type tricarboxylate transporter receptor subunit TctC
LTWNGLMAPANTPKPIIDKIASIIAAAVKDPKFAARLSEFGVDPLGNTPEEYQAMLARDVVTWAEAVEVAGAKQQ